MQIVKNKAQIAPSEETDKQSKEETLIETNFQTRSPLMFPEKRDKSSFQQSKFASYNKLGEGNQDRATHELSELRNQQEKTRYPPLLRTDLSQKRWRIIANFIERIKIYSLSQRFRKSKKSQLDIINDQSFNYEHFYHKEIFESEVNQKTYIMYKLLFTSIFQQQKKPSQLEKLVYKLENNCISCYFYQQDSKVSRVWDTIQFLSLMIYILYLPIRLAFDALQSYSGILEVLPNVIQIINMFLEFNTGFYQQGIVITDRKHIFQHYISKKFIYDLILNICWLISLNEDVSKWFKFIGVFRIVVIVYLINEIEETFQMREIFGNYFDLVKLSGFIFLSAHFTGCCWYALAIYERNLGITNTWLDRDIQNFDIEQVVNQTVQGYIASFYWSIVTMCTVGYGDIGPTTYRERIFVMVVVLLSSFIFGFSMNAIGDIIRNLRENSEIFKQQMTVLNIYMKKRTLNQQLQSKVRRYYEYLYLERKQNNQQGAELIENLAPFLRDEVQKDIYLNMFKQKKLFRLNFSEKLISSLYKIVKEKKYGVDEYLFKEGEISDRLFLILQGEVQIVLQDRVILQTLRDGDFVGQIEFFSNKLYQFSTKTTKFTQIAIIEKKDFMQLLKLRQQDFEQFSQMKDNILQYQNTSEIEHRCESCGKYGHMFDSCRLIKLFSNKHRQIYQFNSLKQFTRQPWRRPNNKHSALWKAFETQKNIQNFINTYNAKLVYAYHQQESSMDEQYQEDNNQQSEFEIGEDSVEESLTINQVSNKKKNNISRMVSNAIETEVTPIDNNLNLFLKEKTPHQQRRSVFTKNINNMTQQDLKKNPQQENGNQTNKMEKANQILQGFEDMQVLFAKDKEVEDNFDKIREFQKYFPFNNIKEVLKKVITINKRNNTYKKKIKQKQSELLKSKKQDSDQYRTEKIHKRVPSSQQFYIDFQKKRKIKELKEKAIIENKQQDISFDAENKFLLQAL